MKLPLPEACGDLGDVERRALRDGVDAVSMLCCLPMVPSVDSPPGSNGTLGKSLKHKAPSLFDELAAPCDAWSPCNGKEMERKWP